MALESYNCVFCQQNIEETNDHVFLNCQFAKICWSLIGITIQSGSDILEALMQVRDQTHPNFFSDGCYFDVLGFLDCQE